MITKAQCKKWIAALRSGKYRQGIEFLKHGNRYGTRYCCLGVAKELFGLRAEPDHALVDFGWMDEEVQTVLTKMNDSGHNFTQIADHIESEILPELKS